MFESEKLTELSSDQKKKKSLCAKAMCKTCTQRVSALI